MKILWLCFLLILSFNTVYAQESYQTEISANYFHSEDDDDFETTFYGVIGDIYFSRVNTSGHPFAEAAFLERIGSVSLLAGKSELESDTPLDADGPVYGAAITYVKPGLDYLLEAVYIKSDLEFDSPVDGDYETDTYGFGIGYYFAPSLLGEVRYTHSESDIEIPIAAMDETFKSDDYRLFAKYVKEREDGTAYNIEGNIGLKQFDDPDDDGANTIVGLSGDYFFTRKISIGGGLGINAGDDKDDEGNTLSIDFRTFLNQYLSLKVGLEKFYAENSEGEDEESYDIAIAMRF